MLIATITEGKTQAKVRDCGNHFMVFVGHLVYAPEGDQFSACGGRAYKSRAKALEYAHKWVAA